MVGSEGAPMRFKLILPAAYLAIAALAWLDFIRLPPDGLANLGLMLVVLPVTLLELALRPASAPGEFVLMPSGLGYYGAHAVFFWSSVALIAALLALLGAMIDRRWRPRP